ncbi:MAG: class I SAM-dependent methyltransferase [Anaerolineales bacterium]|nr:MAG: class I SAM-dependent methyltransferase [Anaerolineales bacterium]
MQTSTHARAALLDYYNLRAPEYDAVYRRDEPVRQAELADMAMALKKATSGRRVLEVPCGTGFWTGVIADTARHVVAVDASSQMLALARERGLPRDRVQFQLGDAYRLEATPGRFDAGVLNFWISHVPQAFLHEFLRRFHERLCTGATVFAADNVYLPGVGGELVSDLDSEDTYKERVLGDGSEHRVLKNYYDAGQLRRLLEPHATDIEIHTGSCYWWTTYQVACPAGVAKRLTQTETDGAD